ncbi:DNA polymerase ligase N-terminal domain-containing protein [Streptomyces sp. NPDC087525]|uniref:DNA polymerase ligase N-terminal domain-containing protein n=1 Tax=Streptomyces sp. NPDC087525 TaxID=3365793 RepID=UPI00381007CA
MNDTDGLARYRAKRHFDRTDEPLDEPRGEGDLPGREPSFVVQIHDASTTHFDFRLEVDGVLRSWSVPKGPSDDPHDKRLAVPTEDHPLEYREYEGVIPGGEYGAGTVIVWDQGTYRPLKDMDPAAFARALERGHASFRLNGTKLRGGYALTRFRSGDDGAREAWLLVKENDAGGARHGRAAPDPRRARSARTGRTLRQVAQEDVPGRGVR